VHLVATFYGCDISGVLLYTIESSADWRLSRDHRASAAGKTSVAGSGSDDEGDDDDDGDELLKRVLIAGGLRSSSAGSGLRRTEHELMEDKEYVTTTAGADTSELSGVVSRLREKVCLLFLPTIKWSR